MAFFRRLALQRFIKAHRPSRQVSAAPRELVNAYEGIIPASLLELWSEKGLGFYGDLQLNLIDPRGWQAVLDRWIFSPPDDVQRVPIAITSFGVLIYYRKLTESDEDVVSIDPVSKQTDILTWSLDDFFNHFLCERETFDTLIPSILAKSARRECGALAQGEVYQIDQMLFSMQMLKISKVDAIDMHHRLRDAVDAPKPIGEEPKTVAEAIPVEYRATFEDIAAGQGLAGLYLSSYVDWHRLLALRTDGQYQLLFWRIDHQTFERTEIRGYSGAYKVRRNSKGDEIIDLDIALRADSLGSDANDERLVAMHSGEQIFLLREYELEDIATAIGGRGTMGSSDYYFHRVTLDEVLQEYLSDGHAAPPFANLPHVLQALIHVEPLLATITHVAEIDPDDEDDGEGTVMCTLSLGTDDGLRKNMPLYSPQETKRQLIGWVWKMDPNACAAGIKYRRGEGGTIEHGPAVGDVLTTRAPEN